MDRQQARSRTRCARLLPRLRGASTEALLRGLLGAPLQLEPHALQYSPPGALWRSLADPLVALLVEAPTPGSWIALELDPRIALCIVDRALGGEGGEAVGMPTSRLRATECGILAYVLGRMLAQEEAPIGGARIGAALTSPEALAEALGEGGAHALPATLRLGEDVGSARIWIPERALDAMAGLGPRLDAEPAFLRALPMTCVLEAGLATLAPGLLRSLQPGDVLIPDALFFDGRARTEIRCQILGSRRLELIGERHATHAHRMLVRELRRRPELATEEGRRMDPKIGISEPAVEREETPGRPTEESARGELPLREALRRAGDAPIEVSIELARVRLPLEELAALGPGSILETRRPIGEAVILRAGGETIASGELVDVDGEIGVRLIDVAG